MYRHTPRQTHTPWKDTSLGRQLLGRHPLSRHPQADTPLGRPHLQADTHPSDRHAPGQTPQVDTRSLNGYCNRWYTSYWNALLFDTISVCNVGHYRNGSMCEKCTGNEIKSTPGDDTNCSVDAPCDGITYVPNAEHSACGQSVKLCFDFPNK